jgi:xanthine dehydrogenase YagS FAD-binding subunit
MNSACLRWSGVATEEAFRRAADAELVPAATRPGNAFKVGLVRATITAVLREMTIEGKMA